MKIINVSIVRMVAPGIVAVALLGGCHRAEQLTDREYVEKAKQLHAANDDRAAVVQLRNALQKNPKNNDARVLLAEVYVVTGAGKQAQTELEIALQRGLPPMRGKLPMAQAFMLQGNYDSALKEAESALESAPGNRGDFLLVEARARMAMLEPDKGCTLFDQARAANAKLIEAYRGAAACAAIRGNRDGARAIVKDAIQIAPDDSQSWVLLGDIDRVDRQAEQSEKEYRRALELKKNNVDALVGLGLIHVDQMKLAEAQVDVDAIDKISRGVPLAGYIQGIIRFHQARYPEAKSAFEAVLITAPTHFPSILWLGLTNFQQGNYEAAITQLNQFLTLVPNATRVRSVLALARARLGGSKQAAADLSILDQSAIKDPNTLLLMGEAHSDLGNSALGTQFLTQAVALAPGSLAGRLQLAELLLQKNDNDGAIADLKAAIEQHPESVAANALLVRAMIQKKDYVQAMQQAEALRAKFPQDPTGGDLVGSIQLLQGQDVAAQATFEKLLEQTPGFFPAANNLALLAIRQGKFDVARGYYQRALKTNPDSLPAILGLHNVERSMGQSAEALKSLEEAVRRHPAEPLPAQLLGQAYLSLNAPRKALTSVELSLRAHPDDPGLLEVQGVGYLAVGEPASALGSFGKLVRAKGDYADAYVYMAAADTALHDLPAAKAALATALKIDPTNPRARAASAAALLEAHKTDEAIVIAKGLQRDRPDAADGYLIEGSAWFEAKRLPDAIRIFAAGIKRVPRSPELRLALAKTQSASNDLPGMVAGLRAWREADPHSLLVNEALGEAYLRVGDQAQALAAYQAQIALQPDNIRSLNNAAVLLLKSSPQEALAFAKRAVQLAPRNADTLDTMGQVELQQGDFKQAVAFLQKAHDLAPQAANTHYFLAVALAKSGDRPLARRELQRLLSQSPASEHTGDAQQLLRELGAS